MQYLNGLSIDQKAAATVQVGDDGLSKLEIVVNNNECYTGILDFEVVW